MSGKIKFGTLVLLVQVLRTAGKERPVIGILAQEFQPQEQVHYAPVKSYIDVGYIKAVEGSGGFVVPIFIRKDYVYYKELLHSINGIVIPGGWAVLQPGNGYYDALTIIYQISKEMNDENNFFPILGVCLGFEGFIAISNNHKDPQTLCDAPVLDEYYPLLFLHSHRRSLLYSRMSEDVYVTLKYSDVTANYHYWCTTMKNFTNAHLNEEWTVLTLNYNRQGFEFISSMEHKKYPFLAIQFHPERYFMEWNSQSEAPYSRTAIQANRYFYDLIVDLAKLNGNEFTTKQDQENSLINNYIPRFWYQSTPFHQAYMF